MKTADKKPRRRPLSVAQEEVATYVRKNGSISLGEAIELIGDKDDPYEQSANKVGKVLSRMVERRLLIRAERGRFEPAPGPLVVVFFRPSRIAFLPEKPREGEPGVVLGEILGDVDGFHYFWPDLDRGGAWPWFMLSAIADKVALLDREWMEQIELELSNTPSPPNQ